MIKLLTMC